MDICARQVVADRSLDIERAGVGSKRMWREPPFEPFGIFFIGNAEGRWRRTGNAESTAGFLSGLAARGNDMRRQAVERALAAFHHQRIEISQTSKSEKRNSGGTTARKTPEGMPDQHN